MGSALKINYEAELNSARSFHLIADVSKIVDVEVRH